MKHEDVIVIGGGQAGLSVGYHLARRGLRFVILDAERRVGDAWRRRWDSLRLFSPARYDGLDGMPFPAPGDSFPTKDEMADYLESYAVRFALPVCGDTRVHRVSRRGDRYLIEAGPSTYEAKQVVVAMASYQSGRVPAFARELDPHMVQLHSSDYRNPSQLREGGVLVAGAGNSGADIALELARSHEVWLAGRDTGHLPFRIESSMAKRLLGPLLFRFVFHRLLTVRTALGRRVRSKVLHRGGPLIRVKPRDLEAARVKRTPGVVGAHDGRPLLEDGRTLDVSNIVWSTGFAPPFGWIDLPIFDERGDPRHDAGIVAGEPGLYFVGLHFLYSMSSGMIQGVGRDATRIVRTIAARIESLKTARLPARASSLVDSRGGALQ